ncbi:MAG: GNAT family N-acetyltransferase [Vulcanococcus sp.]|uniref:GNAT family N-acetyltransferase n=1 Tax=Vulcanococcus sp. TaxID=2856995 RepID=UPI0025DE01AE|nr:GNAT family N-acetyltransferase [Vulcanococcus sp.]MBW0168271.1 GNAT family N-acetyltransferase [Vulcanococcus sp.]
MPHQVRRLNSNDHDALVEIYRQAVLGSTAQLYSEAQQWAWAEQSNTLRSLLPEGEGWVISNQRDEPIAFSLRYPADRLALLYCYPGAQRQGCGRRLINAIEQAATADAVTALRTEASLISKPLFERLGWQVSWREELRIGGVPFQRFRMHKQLGQRY